MMNLKIMIQLKMVLISIIVSLFSILYTISNYNRVQVYDINSGNNNFEIRGYLVTNSKESIFIIDTIRYEGNDGGTIDSTLINFYGITIGNNNNNYYNIMKECTYNEKSLNEILEDIKISFIVKENNIDNNNILIKFIDVNGNIYKYNINLVMKKHYSNNKIMYK